MSVTRDRSGRTLPLLGAALLVAAYGGALAVGAERLNLLGPEDALIETTGALCFALAAAGFLAAAGLPVPPPWAGVLFLTSYATYKLLAFVHAGTIRAHALDELKETSYAAIFLALAMATLAAERRETSAAERKTDTRKGAGAAAC